MHEIFGIWNQYCFSHSIGHQNTALLCPHILCVCVCVCVHTEIYIYIYIYICILLLISLAQPALSYHQSNLGFSLNILCTLFIPCLSTNIYIISDVQSGGCLCCSLLGLLSYAILKILLALILKENCGVMGLSLGFYLVHFFQFWFLKLALYHVQY